MLEILSDDKKIILRDFIESDIADYVSWFTKDIEWMDWDAPWEKLDEEYDEELEKENWTNYYYNSLKESDNRIRTRFEICLNDAKKTHIGWVSSYLIDYDYRYTKASGYRSVGINIVPEQYRNRGFGKSSLMTYIDYLHANNIKSIYTQTWSGNERMINLAKKLGFKECKRNIRYREIKGKKYDGLTFVLDKL